jgi:hypothetical protein
MVKACESNASIDGTHLKGEALHIVAHLKWPTSWLPVLVGLHLRGNTTLFTELLSGESRSADQETVEGWRSYQLLQEIKGYDPCDIYNADEASLFFNLHPSKTFTFQGDFCHGGIKSKQWVTVLAFSADSSDNLPPLVIIQVHFASRMPRDHRSI